MGQEPAADPRDLSSEPERPRAADPGRPDGTRLPRVRALQGGFGRARLRGPARARDQAARGRARGARAGSRSLPRLHGRRVPGRQPAPADPARALARRPRRALRGRRRLPVDLRVHRGDARLPAGAAEALPARDGRAAGGQLPLDAAGARARQPACAAAGRRREATARDTPRRPGTGAAWLRRRRGRGQVRGRTGPRATCGWDAARGDGRAHAVERALGGLRGSVQ